MASTIKSDVMIFFADDLTGVLKEDKSLIQFLKLVLLFVKCSGLIINYDKLEILLLGNSFSPNLTHTPFKDLTIKNSVKMD